MPLEGCLRQAVVSAVPFVGDGQVTQISKMTIDRNTMIKLNLTKHSNFTLGRVSLQQPPLPPPPHPPTH